MRWFVTETMIRKTVPVRNARFQLAVFAVVTIFVIVIVATSDSGNGARTTAEAGAAESSGSTNAGSAAAGTGNVATTTSTVAPPTSTTVRPTVGTELTMIKRITGKISPKSVVASGFGVTFAQNMIYGHTITAYALDGSLLGTIPDAVDLAAFGITGYPAGTVKGGPVEVAFTPDGRKAYVSNYEMYGPGFANPGDDICSPAAGHDNSFVYRVDAKTLAIDQVIEVGPVPKYVAVSPDGRWVLVSNWCGYDLSVIDAAAGKEVQRLPIGAYPRGIAVAPDSSVAYVAAMGSNVVRTVDLTTFAVRTLTGLSNPRHLVLSPTGDVLYATLNASGAVAAVDVATGKVLAQVRTGEAARSMAISSDGQALYVVNYDSSSMSKVATADLSIVQQVATDPNPIGITYDPLTGVVWVACYGGSIQLFQDGAAA
jgi:YVTN family beta-propeller protein